MVFVLTEETLIIPYVLSRTEAIAVASRSGLIRD